MTKRGVSLAPRVLMQAQELPKETKGKFIKTLQLLSADPSHPGLQAKKVQSAHGLYECRVDQSVRLIFSKDSHDLRCWWIGPHDEALKAAAALDYPADDIEVLAVGDVRLMSGDCLDVGDGEFMTYTLDDISRLLLPETTNEAGLN